MKLTVNGQRMNPRIRWNIRNDDQMPVFQRNWVRAENRVVRKLHWEFRVDLKERHGVMYFRRLRLCILPGDLRS